MLAQIDLAKRAGAEHVLCLVETIPAHIDEYARYAQTLNLKWTIIRSHIDISAKILRDDTLLMIADGLLVAPAQAALIQAERAPYIVTFAPGDHEAHVSKNFERIDFNHLWAGLALIRGSDVFEMRTFPEDWDAQSAVLRICVQKDYRRIIWPIRCLEQGYVYLFGHGQSKASESALSLDYGAHNIAVGKRLARSAIGGHIIQKIWSIPKAGIIARASALMLSAGALALAPIGWAVIALLALSLARIFGAIPGALLRNFLGHRENGALQYVQNGLDLAAWLLISWFAMAGAGTLVALFIGVILVGLYIVCRDINRPRPVPLIHAMLLSPALFLLIAAIAAGFGYLMPVAMLWSVLTLAMIIYQLTDKPDAGSV